MRYKSNTKLCFLKDYIQKVAVFHVRIVTMETKRCNISSDIIWNHLSTKTTFVFIMCCDRNESILFHFCQYSGSSTDLRAGG